MIDIPHSPGYRMSSALCEIQNLCNAATWHKANCRDSQCGVNLYQLGLTAKRLIVHCWYSERDRAKRMISETEWK